MCHKDVAVSSIVNNLCRSAPFLGITNREYEENKIESWEKEIAATQGLDQNSILHYELWFADDQPLDTPLSEQLPSAPQHNKRIRSAFREWKDSMRGTLLFPQFQANKSVSRITARNLERAKTKIEGLSYEKQTSSADLEKWYAMTGEEIQGPCEIRQAWKYNDLTPRTYFAQGGTAYSASKYIRGICNSLSSFFPEVHFKTRFSYNDLPVTNDSITFIYDYTSFTSKLAELKHFLSALADFVDDTMVLIVDSFEGILNVSLGELIREYNAVCNIKGEFSLERYLEGGEILHHEVAGFLGVYGNISFSTILHGLHAVQLSGDEGGAKCVGDDVYASLKDPGRNRRDLISRIQELGEVHPQKIRWWRYRPIEEEEGNDDRAWPYIKRPFYRLENRMILEQGLFLPIFGLICPLYDGFHEEELELYSRVKILCGQTLSSIRQFDQLHPTPSVDQASLVEDYIRSLYLSVGLPVEGRLPFETIHVKDSEFTGLFLPCVVHGFLQHNPWDLVRSRFEARQSIGIRVPMTMREREDLFDFAVRNRGTEVDCCMTRRFSYLEKMGWAVSSKLYTMRSWCFEEYSCYYDELIAGLLYPVYRIEVLVVSPLWIVDLALV